jgi:hypothetical protein
MAAAYYDRAAIRACDAFTTRSLFVSPPTASRAMLAAVKAWLPGVVLISAGLVACGDPTPPAGSAASSAPALPARPTSAGPAALTAGATIPPVPAPGAAVTVQDPNPLKLPPRRVTLDAGKRVFTFSAGMLDGARLGSTLVLYAATVVGIEGDDLIIEGRGGPSYKVNGSYVIPVPDDAKTKPGDAVLTEWNGVLKHAVITKPIKDKIGVRFTDLDTRSGEVLLQGGKPTAATGKHPPARFIKQVEGLVPGNYAALHRGDEWLHVLLVSPASEGETKRWFALGFGGAALVADEADLQPIPIRFTPKLGAPVWAEWVGTLRRGTVQASPDPGLFTVKFERAGRPATLGFGRILPPIEP